ncbi:Sulfite reduction-associated complex DsrMKJOP protein DsrM (= HmeC) [invertebrate metagenome]|uniref:Sulfite reduction-associated complex DsrMKJOP protein DsrM (= HmeC) n=1 Tax=invertebrate metagenome TaxID=1711999 RepID=A0A484H6P0_9ZZZZ
MSFVTIAYAVLFYVATAIFVLGFVNKVVQFASAPAPLKIPTMPTPLTRSGAAWRVMREAVLFESLFRSDKWLWLFAALFHASLLLVLLRHARYFLSPAWGIIWDAVVLIQPFGTYAAFTMLAGLLILLVRRITMRRVRYITNPSDVLLLILLLGIALSGIFMTFAVHTDIIAVKKFFVSLLTFSSQLLPADSLLLVHLFCVATLMIVFPFSKLLHFPGVFFSPTRNQCDDARERRHLAGWAVSMDTEH